MKKELWLEMDNRIENILRPANGKNIIIWGYGYSGQFLAHWFKKKNKTVKMFIDDNQNYPDPMQVFKSSILAELNSDDNFIICSFERDETAEKKLSVSGYKEMESYVFIRDILGEGYNKKISYYDWLDYEYGTDISALTHNQTGNNGFYSYGCDYALMDVLDNFQFNQDDAVFDFGLGKGGALIMFNQSGCGNVAGVEIDPDLCEIAKSNMNKCGIENCSIYNEDATKIKEELDKFNYFHMYNPFLGDVFRKVIENIEESFQRNSRKIILIYSGVICHKDVVHNGKFRLVKKIYNNYWSKYTNVYIFDR